MQAQLELCQCAYTYFSKAVMRKTKSVKASVLTGTRTALLYLAWGIGKDESIILDFDSFAYRLRYTRATPQERPAAPTATRRVDEDDVYVL